MYDFKTVLDSFPAAEMVGGRLIMRVEGVAHEIGKFAARDGVFTLTDKGVEFMKRVEEGGLEALGLGAAPAHATAIEPDPSLAAPEPKAKK